MKHKGAVSQTYIERDYHVLPELIRRAKHIATYPITSRGLFKLAANLPTEKFYITDDAALLYINKRCIHGIIPHFTSPYKRKLFNALYEEVMKMKKSEKYKDMGLRHITILALNHPAPCVGMRPRAIEQRISEIRCEKKYD